MHDLLSCRARLGEHRGMSVIRNVLWIVIVVACGGTTPRPEPISRAERVELRAKGFAAYENSEWAACAATFEQADDAYSAACCLARGGDADRAFALLPHAFDRGYRDLAHLETDPDLESLHGDARWGPTIAGLAKTVAAYNATLNPELVQIYTDDQADRQGTYESIDWSVVTPRDVARRKRCLLYTS